ncbi:MAG: MBL fold metallo-hydrolase [Anaerolineales bacterium]|nr:MBL fold metallo-hydrolase [Anaerolineales bacterium]
MKITFHGAARTVTGSKHLLRINGYNLLLECGLFQGRREESKHQNRTFEFNPQKIDAVILSHAHIDHSGNLPNLVKSGFDGPIYTTPATAHLAKIMLLDSGHIQESDAAYVNKKKARRGEPLVEPIYTQEDAAQVAEHFSEQIYDQPFEPIPGVTARLVDAGHILGSAAIVLDIEEKGRKLRVWFSGDIGRLKLPLIRDPILPQNSDYLIMECTYGDKAHRDPELAYNELRDVVRRTVKRKGKIIIPAFAVGRTQELVYSLHQMIVNGEIPGIPIIVDSPLAINASEIFRAHPECFDEETNQFIQQNKHETLLGFDKLSYTRTVEESKALNFRKEPMVIISASGMAEAGRILHHLKNNIEDPKNTILIVSWQAPYTLGRRLADREKEVKIFGERYPVRAEVSTIGGYSAHAGQSFLLEYALAVKSSVRKTYLVHGERTPADKLRELMADKGLSNVYYPDQHITVEI